MHSNFIRGFEKTSGVLSPVAGAAKWTGKATMGALGGPLGAAGTGLGLVTDTLSGLSKMKAARNPYSMMGQ